MKYSKLICICFFSFLWIGIWPSVQSVMAMQMPFNWSPKQKIPGYIDESTIPYLVTDQNQTVHAFSSQPVGNYTTIVYSKWSLGKGWTIPVDILVPPLAGNARVRGVHLDKKGYFHLLFFSGNEQYGEVSYTKAPAIYAGNAQAWSEPQSIAVNSGATMLLRGNDKDELFVIYTGKESGWNIYGTYSLDEGETWAEPSLLFLTYDTTLLPFDYQMTFDDDGKPHVVWGIVNNNGYGEAAYYTSLTQENKWRTPIALATWQSRSSENLQPSAVSPAIFYYNQQLIVSYIDLNRQEGAVTHSFRYSNDKGQTWSEPEQPFPEYVGTSGKTSFWVDTNDVLHMFVSHRTVNIFTGSLVFGIWHSIFEENQWTELEGMIVGERSGTPPFDPADPTPVLIQGNHILLLWVTDPGLARDGVWYSYSSFSAPSTPIQELPTPFSSPLPTQTIVPLPATPTPLTTSDLNVVLPQKPKNNFQFLLIGIVPTAFVIGLVIILNRHR